MTHDATPPELLVVGDDPVEAGMSAVELVKCGVVAHAVRDTRALIRLLQRAVDEGRPAPAVLGCFDHMAEAVAVWHRLQGQFPQTRYAVAVDPSLLGDARLEANRHDWLGAIERPVDGRALATLLHGPQTGPPQDERGTASPASGTAEDETATTRMPSADDIAWHDLAHKAVADVLDELVARGIGTTSVLVESAGRLGRVAVVDGRLVHAEVDGEAGRHALERMFCWQVGRFKFLEGQHDGRATLRGQSRSLAAAAREYARRVDAARRRALRLDGTFQVRWERVRPLPVVAEALLRRIANGMTLSEAIPGDGDDELEAFAALEARIARGAVVPLRRTADAGSQQTGASPRHGDTSRFLAAAVAPGLAGPATPAERHRDAARITSGYALDEAPETAKVRVVPADPRDVFAPPDDLPDAAPHDAILPETLPPLGDPGTEEALPASVPPSSPPPPPGLRSPTGWFAVDVGAEIDAQDSPLPVANAGSSKPTLAPAVSPASESRPKTPPPSMPPASENAAAQHTPSLLQRGAEAAEARARREREEREEQERAQAERDAATRRAAAERRAREQAVLDGDSQAIFDEWSDDVGALGVRRAPPPDAHEVSQQEIRVLRRGKLKRAVWAAALVLLVGGAVVVVAFPSLLTGVSTEREVRHTDAVTIYTQANRLLDDGRLRDAGRLLARLSERDDVPPEVYLAAGVVAAEQRQFTRARAELRRYIDHPRAAHRVRAERLLEHIVGKP